MQSDCWIEITKLNGVEVQFHRSRVSRPFWLSRLNIYQPIDSIFNFLSPVSRPWESKHCIPPYKNSQICRRVPFPSFMRRRMTKKPENPGKLGLKSPFFVPMHTPFLNSMDDAKSRRRSHRKIRLGSAWTSIRKEAKNHCGGDCLWLCRG